MDWFSEHQKVAFALYRQCFGILSSNLTSLKRTSGSTQNIVDSAVVLFFPNEQYEALASLHKNKKVLCKHVFAQKHVMVT